MEVRLPGNGPELENSIVRTVVTHLELPAGSRDSYRRRHTDRRFADSRLRRAIDVAGREAKQGRSAAPSTRS